MEGAMRVLFGILFLSLASGSAWAAEPFVYPTKGQSPEQTEKDKFECYTWAKQQTGFDPMQVPQAAPPPPPSSPQHEGQVVGGAARGAAPGAIGGRSREMRARALRSGPRPGGLGAMRKRSDYRQQQAQYQQQVQQQQAQYQQRRSEYDRAYSACMEGRGYVLK